MLDARHEDEIASRQRQIGRETAALGPQRLFRHLHEDLLAFVEEFFNGIGRLGR